MLCAFSKSRGSLKWPMHEVSALVYSFKHPTMSSISSVYSMVSSGTISCFGPHLTFTHVWPGGDSLVWPVPAGGCLMDSGCPLNGEWVLFYLGTLESHTERRRTGRGETRQGQDSYSCLDRIICLWQNSKLWNLGFIFGAQSQWGRPICHVSYESAPKRPWTVGQ